jgi:hypothetical protein
MKSSQSELAHSTESVLEKENGALAHRIAASIRDKLASQGGTRILVGLRWCVRDDGRSRLGRIFAASHAFSVGPLGPPYFVARNPGQHL